MNDRLTLSNTSWLVPVKEETYRSMAPRALLGRGILVDADTVGA